jgi:hypothetical protein
MRTAMTPASVADLVETVVLYPGQDVQFKYRVYTDLTLATDETITGWTLVWSLFKRPTDSAALYTRTTASGITIATPYATVALTAAVTVLWLPNTIGVEKLFAQLWRNESGNLYPLTGYTEVLLKLKPPLS